MRNLLKMNKMAKEKQKQNNKKEELAQALKKDKIRTRGKIFQGKVIRKFHKRITIEFERMIYIKKYERYMKSRTKIHARLPEEFEKEVNVGDLVKIQECRPLSKIVNFAFIEKIKDASEVTQ
jgi:small subunit ribosomal protein S17